MGKVKIKNIINRAIVFSEPDLRIRKKILPNQITTIDSEKLDEAMGYTGISNLFRKGYLRIEGPVEEEIQNTLNDFGISLEDNQKLHSKEEIIKIMSTGTDYELKKLLESEPEGRHSVILDAALEATGITGSKMDLIEKYTGKNVYKLKATKKEFEK